jgi:SNF2 family DNA or RNA helicase
MSTNSLTSPIRYETPYRIYNEQPLTTKNKKYVYPLSQTFLRNYRPELLAPYNNLIKSFLSTTGKVYNPYLRSYQNEDIEIILKKPVTGLFNEQRLGKTPTILTAIKCQPAIKRTIIIAPKSTHYGWKSEIEQWIKNKNVYCIRGTKKQRLRAYSDVTTNFFITTYETASIDKEYLEQLNFDCIVLDEAHRIKNFRGVQSNRSANFAKRILQLSYKIKYKYALTGTPSSNYSYDIFPILHFLFPKLFTSFWNFINYYYGVTLGDYGVEIGKIKPDKKKELQEFLTVTCIQRKRKDHMKWIPKVDTKIIRLDMTPEQRKVYKKLYETWEYPELDINCQTPLELLLRLRQQASCFPDGAKERFIKEYIEDYPDEKIIITSFFSSYLEQLATKLNKYKPLLMIGSTSAKERDNIKNIFNNNPNNNILIGNIDVIKEGITLEKASTIIVLDPSLTYSTNEQVHDRFIPTTEEIALTKNKQQIIKLICNQTVDEYIHTMLMNKKSSSDIVNNFKTVSSHTHK